MHQTRFEILPTSRYFYKLLFASTSAPTLQQLAGGPLASSVRMQVKDKRWRQVSSPGSSIKTEDRRRLKRHNRTVRHQSTEMSEALSIDTGSLTSGRPIGPLATSIWLLNRSDFGPTIQVSCEKEKKDSTHCSSVLDQTAPCFRWTRQPPSALLNSLPGVV